MRSPRFAVGNRVSYRICRTIDYRNDIVGTGVIIGAGIVFDRQQYKVRHDDLSTRDVWETDLTRLEACEWNPLTNRAAQDGDEWHAEATACLGRNPNWHLCENCAALPEFKRYRKRTPIGSARKAVRT